MNVPKIDFFSLLSTAAAILSAYSAWKSYKTSKRLEEIQDLRLDIVVKDVTYENIPDGHWQHIQFQITNLSTVAALIKKMSIFFHGRTHELSFDGSPILAPFAPAEVTCNLYTVGTDILDGRYSAELTIETDRKRIVSSLKETDFMHIFYRLPASVT